MTHFYQSLLCSAENLHPNSLFHVRGVKEKRVALTIDDGPSSRTGEMLDILRDAGARATFFLHTDHFCPRDHGTQMIERMLAEGHEVANHMPTPRFSILLSASEFASEFARAHGFFSHFGLQPRLFRAAGGFFHVDRMLASLRDHGYFERFIMASYLPWDTHLPYPRAYAQHLIRGAFPGAIFVLHDGDQPSGNRLARSIETLKSLVHELPHRGYQVEPLGQLLQTASHSPDFAPC